MSQFSATAAGRAAMHMLRVIPLRGADEAIAKGDLGVLGERIKTALRADPDKWSAVASQLRTRCVGNENPDVAAMLCGLCGVELLVSNLVSGEI